MIDYVVFKCWRLHFKDHYVFVGVLMGITNMAATIPGFLVPMFVGMVTQGRVRVRIIIHGGPISNTYSYYTTYTD